MSAPVLSAWVCRIVQRRLLINDSVYGFGHVKVYLVAGMPYTLFTPWYRRSKGSCCWRLDPIDVSFGFSLWQ
jgi:hypothetical protein